MLHLMSVEATFTDQLARYVERRVPASEAEDVLQEIRLKLVKKSDLPAENVSAYVQRVARNAVADYHRRRTARGARESMPLEPSGESEDGAAEEVASWLRPMLSTLPPALAEALELTDLRGLSHAEAAAQLGIARTTLTSRVAKARLLLRERLEQCCRIELDARKHVVGWERRGGSCSSC